jgi:hypothetical protein
MSEIKLCKDCKHGHGGFVPLCDDGTTWCCGRLPSRPPNIVSGWIDYTQCLDARLTGGKCGPNATLFEPRPLASPATIPPLGLWARVVRWAKELGG